MANRDLFALGAALSNFGQVFSAMSRDQDERERREAERVEAEKARSQQEIAGISGQLPLTRSFDELRSLQRRADAADPQHQLGQDFQQRKAELEPGERLAIMKRAQEYQAVTGGTGAEALDFVGQPEAGQQPGEFQVPLTQPEVGRLVQEGNAPALEAFRENQRLQEAERQSSVQSALSVMPAPENAIQAIEQFELREGRPATEQETTQITESYAARDAAQSLEDRRLWGELMSRVSSGAPGFRDLATIQDLYGKPISETQVADFDRNLALANELLEVGPEIPSRADIDAVEDQATQEIGFLDSSGEPLPIDPTTGAPFEDMTRARNYVALRSFFEKYGDAIRSGDFIPPSKILDEQRTRDAGSVVAVASQKEVEQLIQELEDPEIRAAYYEMGVDAAKLRADAEVQRLRLLAFPMSALSSSAELAKQREEALRKFGKFPRTPSSSNIHRPPDR